MRKEWTNQEEARLREVHASGMPYSMMMHLWPGRSRQSVSCHAAEMGLGARPVPLRRDFSKAWPAILECLEMGESKAYDIADKLGICREWAGRLLRKNLRSEAPEVHVLRWTRTGGYGPYVEVWAFGPGESAQRPTPLSRVERKRLARMVKAATASGPFSVAAGLASVPMNRKGRVYIHLTDSPEEMEIAA